MYKKECIEKEKGRLTLSVNHPFLYNPDIDYFLFIRS